MLLAPNARRRARPALALVRGADAWRGTGLMPEKVRTRSQEDRQLSSDGCPWFVGGGRDSRHVMGIPAGQLSGQATPVAGLTKVESEKDVPGVSSFFFF